MRITAGISPGWESYVVYDARTGMRVDQVNWADDVTQKIGILLGNDEVTPNQIFSVLYGDQPWPIKEVSCPIVIINQERKYVLINAIVDELKSKSECTSTNKRDKILLTVETTHGINRYSSKP